MKWLSLALSLFAFSAFAANDLQLKKMEAKSSIQRERKALETSESCIDTAMTQEDFKNCNYDSSKFNIQKEEVPDTGSTTERLKKRQ